MCTNKFSGHLRATGHAGMVLGFAVALALLSSGTSGAALRPTSSGSNTNKSASYLVKTALRNAVRAGWVHEVLLTRGQGHSVSMENDIGSHEGRQVVTADSGHAQVIVIGGDAYIEGDLAAVTNYFGLPHPQEMANKWLVLTPNDTGFSTVSDAVTLRSDFGHYGLKGKLKKGPVTVVDGVRTIPVHGNTSVGRGTIPVTLYVSASGTLLPIKAQGTGHGATTSVLWTNWGQPVSLSAPSTVTPITNFAS